MDIHLLGSIIVPFNFPMDLPSQINSSSEESGDHSVRPVPIDFTGMIGSSASDRSYHIRVHLYCDGKKPTLILFHTNETK